MNNLSILIFSKDRAMQLELLLRSIGRYYPQVENVYVSYKASDPDFLKGYEKLFNIYPFLWLQPVHQNDFEISTRVLLNDFNTEFTLMLCDDSVFVNRPNFDFDVMPAGVKCISLYLHPGVDYSFGQDQPMPRPTLISAYGCLLWCWALQPPKSDWGYPHNVAGHIYPTAYIRDIVNKHRFQGVNSLESVMSWPIENRDIRTPYMMCYDKQIVVGMALNCVQEEYQGNNLAKQYSLEELNDRYLNGQRIIHNFEQSNMTIGNYEITFV